MQSLWGLSMISRFLLSIAVVGCLLPTPVFAQVTPPGCNPAVTEAMARKADALVGFDVAVAQEAFDKPDSVLATTCFNKAAGLDASQGGLIFSEPFDVALKDIIEPWLTAFYDEFADASGNDASMPNAYAAAATVLDLTAPTAGAGGSDECGYVERWWQESTTAPATSTVGYKNEGIDLKIPNITFALLRDAAANPSIPGGAAAGADFLQRWGQVESLNNIKSQLDTAMTAVETIKPFMDAAGFTTDNTVCAVMTRAGITCP